MRALLRRPAALCCGKIVCEDPTCLRGPEAVVLSNNTAMGTVFGAIRGQLDKAVRGVSESSELQGFAETCTRMEKSYVDFSADTVEEEENGEEY